MKATVRRVLRFLAALAAAAVLGVAAFIGALLLEHRRETSLPATTGAFSVARTVDAWVDDTTTDPLAPVAGTRRELLVWMWYPTAAAATAPKAEYLPAALRDEYGRMRGFVIGTLFTRDLSKVRTNSAQGGDVSPQERAYPVVIMRGGASAEVSNYSALAEDLASHGYIVVGFDAPYRTNVVIFPDGRTARRTPENNPEICIGQPEQEHCASRVLTAWTRDIAFVLDRLAQLNTADASGTFTGRIDLTRVGVFGHSFGGATAAEFCQQDARCKAVINIDGIPHGRIVKTGIDRPLMFLLSDHSREVDPESQQIKANIQSIYDRAPADRRAYVTIRGANHFLFSDDGALLKSRIVLGALRRAGVIGIDGRRQLEIASYCVHRFFDAYLKGKDRPPLTLASARYPELEEVR